MKPQYDSETDPVLCPVLTHSDSSSLTSYQRELQQAIHELEEEKHKPLGFYDDLLNLLCWIETPEERVHKNRVARLKQTMLEESEKRLLGSDTKSSTWSSPSSTPTSAPHGIIGGFAKRVALAVANAVS